MSEQNIFSPTEEDEQFHAKTAVTVLQYNATEASKKESLLPSELEVDEVNGNKVWVSIKGLSDQEGITTFLKKTGVHPLLIEDVFHTNQRPKVESYDELLYVVLRSFVVKEERIFSEQISFIIKDNFLVSIEEWDSGCFKPVADKLLSGSSSIRKKGEDFLLYSLLDKIIDKNYEIEETLNNRISLLEEQIMLNARKQHLLKLQELKKELMQLRKGILPVRELLNEINRIEIDFFEEENKPYLRDLLDHVLRMQDSLENYRELVSSLMDLYMSQMNNRMNEVMKTLTVLSSVFIPLTFIVGVYGMNFENMPELKTQNGYYFIWAVMILLSVSIILYFKKKKYF